MVERAGDVEEELASKAVDEAWPGGAGSSRPKCSRSCTPSPFEGVYFRRPNCGPWRRPRRTYVRHLSGSRGRRAGRPPLGSRPVPSRDPALWNGGPTSVNAMAWALSRDWWQWRARGGCRGEPIANRSAGHADIEPPMNGVNLRPTPRWSSRSFSSAKYRGW